MYAERLAYVMEERATQGKLAEQGSWINVGAPMSVVAERVPRLNRVAFHRSRFNR
jgi:hypothetical protein